jgi:hypothetical protein
MSVGDRDGIRVALELLHVPSRVHIARTEPLPADVDLLLRIAARDAEAERTATASTGRPRELIRQAAIFFVEQVLLCPNSDSYRVLGTDSRASSVELRRNMVLLVKWLHPDKDPQGQRSVFASRVTSAWDDLKTPERRASYHKGRRIAAQKHTVKSRVSSISKRKLVSSRHTQPRFFVTHFSDSQSLLSRAWLFLLHVARQ